MSLISHSIRYAAFFYQAEKVVVFRKRFLDHTVPSQHLCHNDTGAWDLITESDCSDCVCCADRTTHTHTHILIQNRYT